MNEGPFLPPTRAFVQQQSVTSPDGEVAAPVLCLNFHSILNDVMSKEKRKDNVVGPYAMNFSPFLEDHTPVFGCGRGCKSLPYDPPTFPAALSKEERKKNRVGFLKRKKDSMEREQL